MQHPHKRTNNEQTSSEGSETWSMPWQHQIKLAKFTSLSGEITGLV